MWKINIVVAMTFVMSGCIYQSVNNTDIERAIAFCKGANNIVYIEASFVGNEYIKCKDGTFTYGDSFKFGEVK